MEDLQRDYAWTRSPLVAGAPMRLIALAPLAVAVSRAGGLGFIGAGSDANDLNTYLEEASAAFPERKSGDVLPVGVGFLLWAGESLLKAALPSIEKFKPAAIWLFAPRQQEDLVKWTEEIRRVTNGATKIWIQIGDVAEAREAFVRCKPEVLVVQGSDAGGHGRMQSSSLIALLPEVEDMLEREAQSSGLSKPALVAAGGIADGRGAAGALALGAHGVVLGTRLLATKEANIAKGYQSAVLNAGNGGLHTARGKLYDQLRGTTDWPEGYGGRGILNRSWYEAAEGLGFDENKKLYDDALNTGDAGWGTDGRLTTYAGTAIGLVNAVSDAATVTEEIRVDARKRIARTANVFQ